jgi:hypothetical protein
VTDRLLELAALDAAGALAPGEQQELQGLVVAATPADLATVADLYEAMAMLPAGSALERPSAAVRARILRYASPDGRPSGRS